jgi:hypothetical protein
MDERAVPPSATLVALLPLALLARLTTARAQDSVRDEVTLRLRVTTNMSASLLAEQMASYVTLAEAQARRARLARAVAGGNPARFDRAEIDRELKALQAAREGIAATALLDLDGVLLDSPVAQSGHPLIVTVATYVRVTGRPRAILLLSVRLDAVQPLADTVAAVQGVDLWVTDQRGKLLAAPGGRPPGLKAVAGEPVGRATSTSAASPVWSSTARSTGSAGPCSRPSRAPPPTPASTRSAAPCWPSPSRWG